MTDTPSPTSKSTHISFRVYYEDTDAGGIVYHANFLRFGERARTEMLRSLGYDHPTIIDNHNVSFVVRHIDIDYRAPGKLDDVLTIKTSLETIGNTSMVMRQIFTRDEPDGSTKTLADMRVTVVTITPEGRAVRIPAEIRHVFATE